MTSTEVSRFLSWRSAFRAVEDTCPWPGPRPLRATDGVRLLVGRQRDRERFNHEVQNHRLILLGGESGVGKSSLLDAGLVRDLRKAGYKTAVCRNWGASVSIDDDAFLAEAVLLALDDELRKAVLDQAPTGRTYEPDLTLFDILNAEYGDSLVIIFDQFEELLRYNRARKERIIERIIEIHHRCAIRIVLSFRSEYLHELKEIETSATPFGISRYILEPVDDRFAADVIQNARGAGPDQVVIDPEVATELADRWKSARAEAGRSSTLVARIGMLHLQAMLYALHARADGRIIDRGVFGSVVDDAKKMVGPTDIDLFGFGLQEAVSAKLLRCESAAAEQGLDRFLYRGSATVLSRAVEHLSSGGYKLVHEAYGLAALVLADEIQSCMDAMNEGDRFDGDPSGHTDAALSRMVMAIAGEALRDDQDQRISTDPTFGSGMTARRAALARIADKARQPGELSWVALRDRQYGATAPNNPAAGPMRGLSPADVLIEELQRYGWALVWLKQSSLVRVTRHGDQSMVSLIHDGFGEALRRWADNYEQRDRAWALYALTAPSGASHRWGDNGQVWTEPDGSKGSMKDELSGTPDQPRIFGNLIFKGNSIIDARFENTVFVDCDFRGALFLRCSFAGVTFVNCQLDGALLSDCTVVGRPDPAPDRPAKDDVMVFVPHSPTFNVPNTPTLAGAFRHYGEDGSTGDAFLIAREAGRPAYAAGAPISEEDQWLPWTPARGGFVAYGGRVSALTFRGTAFVDGAISFRGVVGTGLDLAELAHAELEFHRCLLRHVAFTSGTNENLAHLTVTVNYSVAAHWWIGRGFEGSLTATMARLIQVWNDSGQVTMTRDEATRLHQVTDAGTPDYRPTIGDVVARTDYRRGRHLSTSQ